MTPLDKCPKCGSLVGHSIGNIGIQFKCGTIALKSGSSAQALPCVMRQRDQLAEQVKRLEEENRKLSQCHN